jgi:hypothetical protein
VLVRDDLAVFDAIGLADRRKHECAVPGGSTALLAEIKPREFLSVWRRARQLVGETGRWPLVTWATRWEDLASDELFDRMAFVYSDRSSGLSNDQSLPALIARAARLDLAAVLADLELEQSTWHRERLNETVEEALSKVGARWGKSPSASDVRQAAEAAADPVLGIERYLLEWELAQDSPPSKAESGMSAAEQLEWTKRYFEPMPPDEPAALILLPTTRPWEVYAYLEGLWMHPSDRLVAAAHRWHEDFGAECMAILPGYATELRIQRPPADIWQAWEVARQHYILAYDTFILRGIEARDYARALTQSPYWMLLSKP